MDDLSDPGRLRALARTELMDSAPEEAFDRLTRLATRIFDVPVSLISLVDGERQYFKSAVGLDVRQTPLSHSFCQHVVTDGAPLVIANAHEDPRVSENLAIPDLGVIAYAGVPLTDPDGNTLGSFCVISNTPREWAPEDLALLEDLGVTVMTELALRAANRTLEFSERQSRQIVTSAHDAIITTDGAGAITGWNPAAEALFGWSAAEAIGRPVTGTIVPEEMWTRTGARVSRSALTGLPPAHGGQVELLTHDRHGRELTVAMTIAQVDAADGVSVNVFIRDVSELVELEAARLATEKHLHAMVDHAPIGVVLVDLSDPDARLLSVNDAFLDLLGEPDLTGAPDTLRDCVQLADHDALDRALAQLATSPYARVELELRCRHRHGHTLWLLFTGSAVFEDSTAATAIFHVLDIGERKRFEGQLQHLADHDVLTGLYNRRRFEQELHRALASAGRYDEGCALLLIDLDGFKYVNDSLGHASGDELIGRVASIMRGVLRETDVIARLGGDEFAVILPRADEPEAMVVAGKLIAALRARAISLGENRSIPVTASVGVTTFAAGAGLTADELLVEADVAMYQAKELGKDQPFAFVRADGIDGADSATVQDGRSWLNRLTAAIEAESFELLAQPIRAISSDGVDRFELLLRLRGAEGQMILPGTFLSVAERFDLIQRIDRWVFRQAAELLHAEHAKGRDVSFSVNMSGKTLGDPQILADITAILASTPIPPDRLIVEVTETAAIVNIDKAREVARGLRALGCRFALDDFGAGFASFYYLKHLEFDYLKIDGEFVTSLLVNTTDQLVVKSVVEIARTLGAETIAEFVGDEPTLQRLRELGVDHGQGFHLGAAVPIAEALRPAGPTAAS